MYLRIVLSTFLSLLPVVFYTLPPPPPPNKSDRLFEFQYGLEGNRNERTSKNLKSCSKKVSTKVFLHWLGNGNKWGEIFTVHWVTMTFLTLERARKQCHGILILSHKWMLFFLCKKGMLWHLWIFQLFLSTECWMFPWRLAGFAGQR